jgi:hypothetical protein
MFEGTYSPPYYTDLYNFRDGAQNDIFQDSYLTMPVPGPNQTALPVLANVVGAAPNPGTTTFVPASTAVTATPTPTPSVDSWCVMHVSDSGEDDFTHHLSSQ